MSEYSHIKWRIKAVYILHFPDGHLQLRSIQLEIANRVSIIKILLQADKLASVINESFTSTLV